MSAARGDEARRLDELDARVQAWTDAHRDDIVDLIASFVERPSENRPPGGDEARFQAYFAEVLSGLRMKVDTFRPSDVPGLERHPSYWSGRSYVDRPNVVGRRPGRGGGRSLLLAGHGDVVIGLTGTYPPFEPVLHGDRLYGRGSVDMKGGLAAAVSALRCLDDLGIDLAGDVLVESDVDEEMGGANGTLASRLAGYDADAAIVLEPSELVLAPAHLGGRVYRITLTGQGGMGFGADEVVNPIPAMARLIMAVERFAEQWALLPPPSPELSPGRGLETIVSIAQAGDFAPGTGDGVPRQALVEVWVEAWPGTDAATLDEAFLGACRAAAANDPVINRCRVEYEHVTRLLRGSAIPESHPAVVSIAASARRALGGAGVPVRTAPFACDAFLLHDFGIPAVVLGPRGGNAHGADEYVLVSSVQQLVRVLVRALVDWCGPAEGV
jgi:acetylornithine deacetylase